MVFKLNQIYVDYMENLNDLYYFVYFNLLKEVIVKNEFFIVYKCCIIFLFFKFNFLGK